MAGSYLAATTKDGEFLLLVITAPNSTIGVSNISGIQKDDKVFSAIKNFEAGSLFDSTHKAKRKQEYTADDLKHQFEREPDNPEGQQDDPNKWKKKNQREGNGPTQHKQQTPKY